MGVSRLDPTFNLSLLTPEEKAMARARMEVDERERQLAQQVKLGHRVIIQIKKSSKGITPFPCNTCRLKFSHVVKNLIL